MNTIDEVIEAVGIVWLRKVIRNGGCPFCFAIEGGEWVTAHKAGCKVGEFLERNVLLESKLTELIGAPDPANEAWD